MIIPLLTFSNLTSKHSENGNCVYRRTLYISLEDPTDEDLQIKKR